MQSAGAALVGDAVDASYKDATGVVSNDYAAVMRGAGMVSQEASGVVADGYESAVRGANVLIDALGDVTASIRKTLRKSPNKLRSDILKCRYNRSNPRSIVNATERLSDGID
jgi:hypothetical protein